MQEIYDTGGVERGQRNKQGRMEKEANQLHRRPQMTGQARYEEEEEGLYYFNDLRSLAVHSNLTSKLLFLIIPPSAVWNKHKFVGCIRTPDGRLWWSLTGQRDGYFDRDPSDEWDGMAHAPIT